MSERDRALTIPDTDEELRIKPVNGGWMIYRSADMGLQAPDPIAVTSVADLARIITEWAAPPLQVNITNQQGYRNRFAEDNGGLLP